MEPEKIQHFENICVGIYVWMVTEYCVPAHKKNDFDSFCDMK